jgi:hypothetical protein
MVRVGESDSDGTQERGIWGSYCGGFGPTGGCGCSVSQKSSRERNDIEPVEWALRPTF